LLEQYYRFTAVQRKSFDELEKLDPVDGKYGSAPRSTVALSATLTTLAVKLRSTCDGG
jgi:hypothetical protein